MKILLVDDDFVDREQVKRILRNEDAEVEFIEAESVDDGLVLFSHEQFDMVLLDYRMPKKDGIIMLRELRAMPVNHNVAIVMLSHSEDIQLSLDCIAEGAQDFIVKGNISTGTLKRAVLHAQVRFELEQGLRRSFAETKKLAEQDSLTGLANRHFFEQVFNITNAKVKRLKSQMALIMFDLDYFKKINDIYGHNAGDKVLKQVAVKVSKFTRTEEVFARLGGDEFVILLSGETCDVGAIRLARNIINALAEPIEHETRIITTGASIGIALHQNYEESLEALISHADIALYRAKNSGRNQVCFFQEEMQLEFERRNKMEIKLKEAILQHQLDLYYQPIVSITDKQMVGYESTLRLHQGEDILTAAEFIDYAQESDVIWEIGRWSIETSLATLPHLQKQGIVPFMSINLSPQQLDDPSLVEFINSSLKIYEVEPKRVIFEIDESAFQDKIRDRKKCMHKITSLGCRLALDSYGSGVTAISHVLDYPISVVKIDQHLIQSEMEKDKMKLLGILAMLQTFNVDIVLKGIETEQQHKQFAINDMLFAQGYFYSRPTPLVLFNLNSG